MRDGFQIDVNKTVFEIQIENKRDEKIKLPTAEDIAALNSYLSRGRIKPLNHFKHRFLIWHGVILQDLISLPLFNRRRAGELERICIHYYRTYEYVDINYDSLNVLKEKEKSVLQNYARFYDIVKNIGFLNRIPIYLAHLEKYNIPTNVLEYSNPLTLRGTELRKQTATAFVLYNLSDPLVEYVANHSEHHIDVHMKMYTQSTAREISTMVEILLKALGEKGNIGSDMCKTNDNTNIDNTRHSESNLNNISEVNEGNLSPKLDLPSTSSRQKRVS
ncbi:hypothetical protein JTB14_011643 [Gonioctena quinquepunctata]|nr:hypothetical protein JTB14_011643 [Gonioctena quinquepunctata]